MKPKKKIKVQSKVDYSTGPAYQGKSKSRQVADKKYAAAGGDESGLKSKLTMDSEGNYIRRSVDSSPAYKKGGKFKVLSKTRSVDPPKGFHWMQKNGEYYLMKGDYKPHPGAVAKASFKLVDHPKG